ncbi:fish-egg lectin-like isoform X2 [Thalassophryne amazonica]|uniref:fish-egg lectin-like isoform X2 n=1 Tax=Thalassophryne amazonica TaxID=390379 RepID=UPI001470D60E|nr:fish-egg lectin-like isoform X2 [Thalassophryne amazonica]
MKAAVFLLMLCYVGRITAFKCEEAQYLHDIVQIDAGQGHVVATTKENNVFIMSGNIWISLGKTKLKHVTVGRAGIWGVNDQNYLFRFVADEFQRPKNAQMLAQVDAGADHGIVGVSENTICLKISDAQSFIGGTDLVFERLSIDDLTVYISCGGNGCWGVTKSNTVQFTQTLTTSNCTDSGWEEVPKGPQLTMIEVSESGRVFALDTAGSIFERTGISTRNPKGEKWTEISMCFVANHVTFDLKHLWVATKSGFVLNCTE